jgi:hypothetical protein
MTMSADRTIMTKGSRRNAFSMALIMIAAAAMYNWIVSPHVGYLRAVQRYQPVVDEMAEETGRISRTLDKRRQQLRTMRRELAETRDSFFTRGEAKAFLDNLQSFVEQTGCKVITADFTSDDKAGQPRESKELAPVAASHVHLTVAGQYDPIVTLLERLQTSRKKIWVDSCGLTLSDLRSGRLECRLVLTLYALSEKDGRADE